ncbi:MAG: hypothetical protein KKD39_05865, partial [Candidatus Altiarchaeota archaeon]|nr:hypothetical protein [Candidatus Altiarchaeota archaeon]
MLNKLILAAVLVPLSHYVYQWMFDVTNWMTTQMFTNGLSMLGTTTPSGSTPMGMMAGIIAAYIIAIFLIVISTGFGLGLIFFMIAYIVACVLMVFTRFALVILFYILFPATVFLYLFEYTRSLGGNLLMKSLTWLLVGPVMGLVLCITVLGLVNMTGCNMVSSITSDDMAAAKSVGSSMAYTCNPSPPASSSPHLSPAIQAVFTWVVGFFMFNAGMIAIVAVPLVMTALMKWIGGAVAAAGMAGLATSNTRTEQWKNFSRIVVGHAMMGGGSSSLLSASASMGYMLNVEGKAHMMGSGSEGGGGGSSPSTGGRSTIMSGLSAIFSDKSAEPSRYWGRSGGGGMSGDIGVPTAGAPGGVTPMVRDSDGKTIGGSAVGGTSRGGGSGGDPFGLGGPSGTTGVIKHAEFDVPKSKDASSGASAFGGSTLTPSELTETKDGKSTRLPEQMDTYNQRDVQGAITTKETTAAIIPAVNILGRVDTAFGGGRDIGSGFKQMFTQPGVGTRIQGFEKAAIGVGKILLAFVPLSPFMPIRMIGRTLVSLAPSHMPPGMAPIAMWMGEGMMGLGFRQIMGRSKLNTQAWYYDAEYERLSENEKKLAEAVERERSAATPNAEKIKSLEEELNTTRLWKDQAAENFTKTMDKYVYQPSVFGGGKDWQGYQRVMNKVKEKNRDLYDEYTRRSMVGAGEDPLLKSAQEILARTKSGKLTSEERKKVADIVEESRKTEREMREREIEDMKVKLASEKDSRKIKALSDGILKKQKVLDDMNAEYDQYKDLSGGDRAEKVVSLFNARVAEKDKEVDDVEKRLQAAVKGKDKDEIAERTREYNAAVAESMMAREGFVAFAFMKEMGVGSTGDAKRDAIIKRQFLEANQGMLATGDDGQLTRRRHVKLTGVLGGAAEDYEKIYRQRHYQELRRDGVSHKEAVRLSETVNLRIYRDKENNVYMSSHDLKYLNQELKREDTAVQQAKAAGMEFKSPASLRYWMFNDEDYERTPWGSMMPKRGAQAVEHTVTAVRGAELTLESGHMNFGDPLYWEGELVRQVGTGLMIHDRNKLNVVEVEETTQDKSRVIRRTDQRDGEGNMAEVSWKDAQQMIREGNSHLLRIEEHVPVPDGQGGSVRRVTHREVSGMDEAGGITYRAKVHYGEQSYQDNFGNTERIAVCSQLAGSREDMISLATGVSKKSKEFAAESKKADAEEAKRAEGIREAAKKRAAAMVAASHENMSEEQAMADVEEADASIHIYKQD